MSRVFPLPKKRGGLPVGRVTDHVLIRWLERIEGIDLTPIRENMRRRGLSDKYDRQVVEFIEANSEFSFDEIEHRIRQAIAIPALAGHIAVRHGDFVIRLAEGVAVSITPFRSDLPDTSRRKRATDLRRPRRVFKKTKWSGDDD